MSEIAERLKPKYSTLRSLLLRSGNQCAFPDCERKLINAKDQWVGEVCHVSAAMPGGERFDSGMTNEERRSADNLLLMCHDHHVETNDVSEFDVWVCPRAAGHDAPR